MEPPCRCNLIPPEIGTGPQESSKVSDENKVADKVVVDFGEVAVFGTYTKTLLMKNMNKEDVASYRIKREAVGDFYDNTFEFNKKEGFVKANEEFVKLRIVYSPTISAHKDVACFEFVDSGYNIIKIIAKGQTKGPLLTTSTNVIRFVVHQSQKKVKRIFEINNNSDIPAEFIFDIDEKQELFQVEPRKGVIEKRIYITVFFSPKSRGVFAQQLTCFVWAHRPLTMYLFGLSSKEHIDQKNVIFQPYQPLIDDTLENTGCSRVAATPITISKSFIDFGRLFNSNPDQRDALKLTMKRQTTSLTNYMNNDIEVSWNEGDEVFCVNPRRARISPNNSFFFDFHFSPTANYRIYSRILIAQVYWVSEMKTTKVNENAVNVPFTATITLQGNSFPEDAYLITNVEVIPSRVIFPACLPEDVAIQNFKIRNVGPIPVMFKLVAPYSTIMVLNPMAGTIRDFVIIQARLRTEESGRRQFFETWQLVVNGQEEKKIPISLSGFCDVPSLQIGDDNVVALERVQADTYGTATMTLRNTSGFHLRFEITMESSNFIQLEPTKGFLDPYGEIPVTFTYTANLCSPKKTSAMISFQTVQRLQELVGHIYKTEFNIYTDFSYSQLCVTPSFHNFGIVQRGTVIQTVFNAFNFGDTAVTFDMKYMHRSHNLDSFQIEPHQGEVKPGEQLEIEVKGCVNTLGGNEVSVVYWNRLLEGSEMEDVDSESLELYKFYYDCQYPRLQIEDIVEHDFGLLFNKKHMWEFLNIDRLNDLFSKITEEETEEIDMVLPDFEVGQDIHYITLLIENTTHFETTIQLKRKKICDCPLREVQNTFNTTKNMYDCPHREIISMEMSDTTFYGHSTRLLTISVKYSIPGETKMAYTLDLGDDKIIEMFFFINALEKDVGKISCYAGNFSATLTNVALSRKAAPIQTYWVYNNTEKSVSYEMDTEEVDVMCRKERFDTLRMVNPVGEIEPYSAWPLMIKFHPIEMKEYQVCVPIDFGSSKEVLEIRGSGRHAKKTSEFLLDKVARICTITHKMPVTFSNDYLTVDPLLVWNSTEQIIFIKNVTKDRIMEYTWEDTGIRDVVKITVVNKYGTLKPKESHTILIKISSFNEACITDMSLSCTLLDLTQMYVYKKSLELYEEKEREIEGQFTLSETGVEYLKNDVVVLNKPEPTALSINIDINIIHPMDLDSTVSSRYLFTCSPQNDLDVDIDNILLKYYDTSKSDESAGLENAENVRAVMRQLISEVVSSKTFEILLELSADNIPVYYNQVTLDDQISSGEPIDNEAIKKIREEEIRKFFSRPKLPVLSDTLKELILDSIQATFQLGISYPEEYDEKKVEKEVELLLPVCTDCACKINKK